MNARDAIAERAASHGWEVVAQDEDGVVYDKGDKRVTVRYRMFGAASNYLLRYYGKDERLGVNWGVEEAYFDDQPVVGKNKKQQVLTYLRLP